MPNVAQVLREEITRLARESGKPKTEQAGLFGDTEE